MVTNTGGSDLANVAVTDNRVAAVSCPTTSLAPGTSVTCTGTYAIRLQDIAANGFITNTATAVGTTPIGQKPVSPPATASIPVAADLALAKTVDNQTPVVGSNVVYTVTVSNAGPSEARNIVVSDPTPIGATFISAVPSVGTYDSTAGTWSIPALAVNGSATLTITDRIDSANAVVNSATVTTRDQPDLNPSNETGSTTVNPVVPTTDIAVLKSVDTAEVRVGQTFTSTVTVNNEGPFPATGITVRDPIPIGAAFVSATGTGSYDPDSGVWTVGDLSFPGSATIQIVELAVSPGFVINTAALASVSPTDVNPNNDVATANVNITPPLADLGVAKIVRPPDNALVGDTVSFVVSATNSGPDTSPNVVVNDALTSGLQFVSANPEVGTYDAATGVWTIGALAPGISVRLELFTTATAVGFQANGVKVTDPGITDPNGDNNAASAGIQIAPVPPPPVDVGITKELNTGLVAPRTTTVSFTLTASNAGPNPATGVVFTDVLPAGLDFVSATPSQGTYDSSTGRWSVGTVPVGATPTLILTALANGGAGTYTNAVALSALNETDTNDQNNAASASVQVQAEADLSVTKSVSPTTAQIGDTATYTVTVTNNGPDDDTNIQLLETNRTPATFTAVVTTQGTFDPDSRVWTVGDLASGATATITVDVLITTPLTVINRTIVFTADLPDPDLSNNEASATLIVPGADLSISKIVDVPAPALGSNVTFSIGVGNNGPDTAQDVVVDDPLPTGLTFVSATASVGTYDAATGVWTIGDVLPGGTATLTVVATVTAAAPTTNTATVSGTGPPDVVPDNDTASVTVTPMLARVTVTKTVSSTAPAVGDTVRFTISVQNAGPGAAGDVVVTDNVPTGLTPLTASPECTITGQAVVCQLGALAANTGTSVFVDTRVDQAGPFTNGATVAGVAIDPGTSVEGATVTVDATTPAEPGGGGSTDESGLPFTGAAPRPLVFGAFAMLGLGAVCASAFRRRRRALQ